MTESFESRLKSKEEFIEHLKEDIKSKDIMLTSAGEKYEEGMKFLRDHITKVRVSANSGAHLLYALYMSKINEEKRINDV